MPRAIPCLLPSHASRSLQPRPRSSYVHVARARAYVRECAFAHTQMHDLEEENVAEMGDVKKVRDRALAAAREN